jgi:3-hydroxyacyl-CoA dehydrogenase
MGSRIAAHIANAGLPVVLLDIVPPGIEYDAPLAETDKFVLVALDGLKKSKPAAFYVPESARLITPGNFDDDLALIADCDWIIEVVAENLEIKRSPRKGQQHRRPGDHHQQHQRPPHRQHRRRHSDDLRHHFFGTHFFNPPRYMRCSRSSPLPRMRPRRRCLIEHFCDQRLGKTVVHSHDTPNFIANRIGTFSMGNAIRLMMAQGLTIEEVDVLTGSPFGWPKTGTFRLGDMVGVDVLAHVANNFSAQAAASTTSAPTLPWPRSSADARKKWLGDKTKQGFYKKEGKDEQGRDLRHVLDWQTLEYKPSTRPKFPAIEMAKNVESTPKRIAQLLHADPEGQSRSLLLAAAH